MEALVLVLRKELVQKQRNKMTNQELLQKMKEETQSIDGNLKEEVKQEIIRDIEKGGVSENIAEKEEKIAEKTTKEFEKDTGEVKKEKVEKRVVKKIKNEAVVNGYDLPISTKHSSDICRFIKGKGIGDAIRLLEEIAKFKKALPMKGEIPHRKDMMSGRYPVKAIKGFIILLKSLASNSSEIDDPVIVKAFANIASRPYGRFGRVRKKRTHVKIIVIDKKMLNKNKKIGGKISRLKS